MINIYLTKEKTQIIADIEVPLRGPQNTKIKYLTSDILKLVSKKLEEDKIHNIYVTEVLQNCTVTNLSESQRKGQWIFKTNIDLLPVAVLSNTKSNIVTDNTSNDNINLSSSEKTTVAASSTNQTNTKSKTKIKSDNK